MSSAAFRTQASNRAQLHESFYPTTGVYALKLGNQALTPQFAVIPVTWLGVTRDGSDVRWLSSSVAKVFADGWYTVFAHISVINLGAGQTIGIETTINGARDLTTYNAYKQGGIANDIDTDYTVKRPFAAGTTLAIGVQTTDATGSTLRGSRCAISIFKESR